jgi:hypothetical protein
VPVQNHLWLYIERLLQRWGEKYKRKYIEMYEKFKILRTEEHRSVAQVIHITEKIFADHIFDKELISRMYKELVQLNNKNK